MDYSLCTDRNGYIEKVSLAGKDIPFRRGEYAGPAFRILYNGQLHNENGNSVRQDEWHCLSFKGVQLGRKVCIGDYSLNIHLRIRNSSSQVFRPERLSVMLGIDSYMIGYPQWNDRLFPTLLQCEKTHFYGYFSSPQGDILAIACPQPIAGWNMVYNQFFSDGGHRIEGVSLDLLNSGPLPEHHPDQSCLLPGETKEWTVSLRPAAAVQEALKWASEKTQAPVFCGDRLIFEREETAELLFYAPSRPAVSCNDSVFRANRRDDVWAVRVPAQKEGEACPLYAACGEKTGSAYVYWRKDWIWYLQHAAEQAILKAQKASSHVESWYGYFSGLLAMRFAPDAPRDKAILDSMNEMIPLVFDMERGVPTHIPERIQNTAGLVSICTDAWQATGDRRWLSLAQKLADFLTDHCHAADGSFRNGAGIHYTCVVYPAKSLLELWQAEQGLPQYRALAEKHFQSVRRAVDDLVLHLDNIGTEGEHTFEDGMISCAFLQIAFFALCLPETERGPYVKAAETLLSKHRCLERMGSPDCRSRNTTIRFWEAQYDVLTPGNMISSPHGWTAWKIYGVWYLYLLTGKTEYLTDVMETAGSCAQLMDPSGELRWAFCVDPQIRSGLWQEDPPDSGKGRLFPAVMGECYLPMISGWYRAPEGKPVFGYLGTWEGFETDQGGCCDNDVHECFKAMAETVLLYGYVYEDRSGIHAYNGHVEETGSGEILFVPNDPMIMAVHFNFRNKHDVLARFDDGDRKHEIHTGWLKKDGSFAESIPVI